MVNNDTCRLVAAKDCKILINAEGRIAITNGPIYELAKAQALLKLCGLRVINTKAVSDQANKFNPELDDNELVKFICELQPNDYKNSERCATSVNRSIDCDAYTMKWNRMHHVRWAHGYEIYVKFGYFDNISKCLVVSIHP